MPGWHRNEQRRQGRWRFVAFSRSAGESGDTMLHKWRSATGLGSARYDELFMNKRDLLQQELGRGDSVVLIDDFSGTGRQVCDGWREVMAELLPEEPTVYLVLVVASLSARQKISEETPLRLLADIQLRQDDNVFSATCRHFTNREKDILLRYCRRANRPHPKGFGDCGFVVVLAHKTPNNSIPILHANHALWSGLFPR